MAKHDQPDCPFMWKWLVVVTVQTDENVHALVALAPVFAFDRLVAPNLDPEEWCRAEGYHFGFEAQNVFPAQLLQTIVRLTHSLDSSCFVVSDQVHDCLPAMEKIAEKQGSKLDFGQLIRWVTGSPVVKYPQGLGLTLS
jgi:hypothetical protein